MRKPDGISIIVPVLNEAGNITNLLNRIETSMHSSTEKYEVIFVDDNSTDLTTAIIRDASQHNSRIRLYTKVGKRGKAYSIIEGVGYAKYVRSCMIDADLQYPPENIPPMLRLMSSTDSDIVITNRKTHDTSFVRKLTSSTFNLVFIKGLFGIDYDTQSGLKIFNTTVLKNISISPSPWSFDLEFIVSSLLNGYTVASYDITPESRTSGEAKVNVIKTSYELAKESIKLRKAISGRELRKRFKENTSRLSVLLALDTLS